MICKVLKIFINNTFLYLLVSISSNSVLLLFGYSGSQIITINGLHFSWNRVFSPMSGLGDTVQSDPSIIVTK
jgi:hypothetical protein